MHFAEMPIGEAAGAILAHSVRHADGTFRKGRVLEPADIAALEASGVERVFAARLEPGDVAEDAAAGTVAKAVSGPGALAQAPFTGRANVHAAAPGIALIDATRTRALNRLHESLTLATVAPFEIVAARQMLATVKVIPFAVPAPALDDGAGPHRIRTAGRARALHAAPRRPRHHRAAAHQTAADREDENRDRRPARSPGQPPRRGRGDARTRSPACAMRSNG
jgi:hypothetical protein